MSETVETQIPVFLPGSNRDWTQVQGLAEISSEGIITIRMAKKEDAERLVDLAKEGILFQCAFDYRMKPEKLEEIQARYHQEVQRLREEREGL